MTDIPLSASGAAAAARRRRLNPTLARYLSAFRTPRGIIGLSILTVMALAALLAPLLFPGGYDQQGPNALAGPSAGTSSVWTNSAVTSSSAASTDCAST
ncbi:hypothetical protein SAZ11_49080 [Streptomyces sp. FXJ1.4098]|nr:hypothetical protein [Streptomyces sp. FXJ1.4098]